MKAVSDFLVYVIPYAPGCPEFVAERAVVDAAIEFCERSLILTRTLDPVSVQAGEALYELDGIDQLIVHMPVAAWYLAKPLTLLSEEQAPAPMFNQSIPGISQPLGEPRAIAMVDDTSFSCYPVPAESVVDAITVRAALRPADGATRLPDELYTHWRQEIAAGALASILLTVGQPYSNPNMAAVRDQLFRAGVNRARLASTRGSLPSVVQAELRGL